MTSSGTTQTVDGEPLTRTTGGTGRWLAVPERQYRPELHGIRGVAILGVVVFHLYGDGRVSGGIDIFLAISGFLFTGMLLREATEKAGRFNVFAYLSRLIRRILPPAVLVIVFTAVMGLIVMPVTQHGQLLTEARASLLYFQNIELVNSQLAYEAAGPETSPFQHFWSLSVQGQFFLIWPLIAVLAVFIAKRSRLSPAMAMAVLTGAVFTASFVFSMYMGQVNQEAAYLMTRTRLWELAFGGLLALMISGIRLPQLLRDVLGWFGLILIVTCGFLVDGAALFPGPWAFWPLLGMALVVVSAGPTGTDNQRRGTVAHLMSTSPVGWLGTLAYGLYLWHWPLLIFYLEVRDNQSVAWPGGSFILLISLAAAWVTYREVEQPMATLKFLRPWLVVPVGAAVLIAGAWYLTWNINQGQATPADDTSNDDVVVEPDGEDEGIQLERGEHPGALALLEGDEDALGGEEFYPDAETLAQDEPPYYDWDCRQEPGDSPDSGEVLICEDPEPPAEPTATVMLAGGSHAGQWHDAFIMLGEVYGWEVILADKSGCRFGHTDNPEDNKCAEWNLNFSDALAERDVDVVVTAGTLIPDTSEERIESEAPARWQEIVDTGADLLLLRGTPRPDDNVADCLAEGDSPDECAPDESIIAETNPLDETDLPDGTHTIDLTSSYICPERQCSAVIGGVAVYRDDSHLSSEYVESLAPMLDREMREKMPQLFE
ncbi:acyltransferase family protein [Nesterenkonia haasae]|uniref:acyltransferase family protein n=1 Tax=Nesterenkonia haasae TaxID=2587813 RepID=UPI0013919E85|nr:acyltransferase family protein [Nesterenkonia haasae]NDK32218.1 acyltransferase [Nesterenkonia haasae]